MLVLRRKVIEVLRAMQAGAEPLLDGCRFITQAVPRLGADIAAHEAALVIRGVESETDSFPSGLARANWSDDALRRIDAELAEYFAVVRENLLDACRRLQEHLELTQGDDRETLTDSSIEDGVTERASTNDLRPDEIEITGRWVFDGQRMHGDAACDRIKHLTSNVLELLGLSKDYGGWETLYRDRADGRLWERTYPQSELQGGGPPRLSVISKDEAVRKYGPVVPVV